MRPAKGKLTVAVAMLLAASFVGGCGDDDAETSGGAGGSGAGGPGAGGSGGE